MSLLTQIKSPRPKAKTKLSHALLTLAEKVKPDSEFNAIRCERAAIHLDQAAVVMGARGPRVKTLGAYIKAKNIYEDVSGQAWTD